jgi:hypothetical protein
MAVETGVDGEYLRGQKPLHLFQVLKYQVSATGRPPEPSWYIADSVTGMEILESQNLKITFETALVF